MSCKHYFVEAVATKLDYEKSDNGRIEIVVRRKVCYKCYKTKTETELEATIEQQAKQIEALKNCINCKHIIEDCGDYLCKKNFPDKLEKCRHWEGIACDDQQQKK